ncbi:putative ABC transport system permease protein [Ruminococcus flavefaciens]|uniref:Putative ABC transport system permease protein n=1 Tax=Ruminococcus flavefaciens TaxID=1265 RepID=A0A1H6I2C1_RUMFL|nr:FtsX-like permease family protein [Ruminococcus flavefaciens]SEH40460.1 putative ABC transport system permease protein [Ruminococcus flavefaciens]
MGSAVRKTTLREIRGTFGRFFAIMAIIALGVGFFTGVRITTPAMVDTVNRFLEEKQLYDYRLISSLGWQEEDIADFKSRPDVRAAEGSYTLDILTAGTNEYVFRAHSITENINGIRLTEGRMPQAPDECIIDRNKDRFPVGTTFTLSDENSDSVKNALKSSTFTVVGIAESSMYINFERGTTSVGNGEINSFIYLPKEAFDLEVYTEAYIRFDQDYTIYSDEYDSFMDGRDKQWESIAQSRADLRYDDIYSEAESKLNDGKNELESKRTEGREKLDSAKADLDNAKSQLDEQLAQLEQIKDVMPEQYASGMEQYNSGLAEYESGLADYESSLADYEKQISDAEADIKNGENDLAKLKKPEIYVLDRNTNIGYACFENDSEIVAQVARIFPVFFILVAALVCMTTMSRMVEEQRTQIGVFKALGYSEGTIMGKFMFYSGLAALIGCVLGYGAGTYLFPKIIWTTYELMYLKLPMHYLFDQKLALIALAVSLICSVGTTWFSCRMELSETAAGLMRPKAPKAGKRVFLEYIGFIWKRMKFLHKVSIRNIFRYKKRFFMMILGIGGCTALLVTGFGIKDSIAGFAEMQYGDIQVADGSASLRNVGDDIPEELKNVLAENTSDYTMLYTGTWDLLYGKKVKSVTVNAAESFEDMDRYFIFKGMDGSTLAPPAEGEAVVSHSIAERYGFKVGDTMKLRDENMRELEVKVSGVFENHVYNLVFMGKDTMEQQLGEKLPVNYSLFNFKSGADASKTSASLSKSSNITAVMVFDTLKERLSKMMSSLDYIVLVVIICAAGLAFIVLYNLTNINITERVREIATIKVLGFFRRETSSYVLRENIALTAIGTAIGLVLGIFVHRFVMAQIRVDMVDFSVRILPKSFIYSIILTFLFTFIVDLFMELKLEKINMAESLKSIE